MAPFPCIATNTSPPLGGGAKKATAPRSLLFFYNNLLCTLMYVIIIAIGILSLSWIHIMVLIVLMFLSAL